MDHSPYRSLAWKALRQQVITRSKGRCEKCKERPGEHVHHLFYHHTKQGLDRILVPLSWLQHVCTACHGDYHPHRKFEPASISRAKGKHRKELREFAEWKARKERRERLDKRDRLKFAERCLKRWMQEPEESEAERRRRVTGRG